MNYFFGKKSLLSHWYHEFFDKFWWSWEGGGCSTPVGSAWQWIQWRHIAQWPILFASTDRNFNAGPSFMFMLVIKCSSVSKGRVLPSIDWSSNAWAYSEQISMLLTKSTTWLIDHFWTSTAAALQEWAAQLKRQFGSNCEAADLFWITIFFSP